MQTIFWLAFGLMYPLLAAALLFNRRLSAGFSLRLVPAHCNVASNKVVKGASFGFSTPVCATPILLAAIRTAALPPVPLEETRGSGQLCSLQTRGGDIVRTPYV